MTENRVWRSEYPTQWPAQWKHHQRDVRFSERPCLLRAVFLSPAPLFREGEEGEEEGDRPSHNQDLCFRGHATGARLPFDS